MAVRSSMSDLIARVRLLIGDPASATATFSDQNVQDWLDRTQLPLMRYELETAAPDIVPQGSAPAQFNWATYVSDYTDWEADAVFQGTKNSQQWVILTPLTADYQRGVWTFDVTLPTISSSIPAQLPPVFATGKCYDPYLAAADLLEMWSALLADAFDFTSDGQTFRRSQRMAAKLQLANVYKRQAKPRTVQMVRSDLQQSTSTQPVHLIGESNDFGR